MNTDTTQLPTKLVNYHDLLAALGPVLDWYQSDEHPPREPLDIIRDIVDDLQSDRKAALAISASASDAFDLCNQIEQCGCSEELTKASIMANNLRAKLNSASSQTQAPQETDKQLFVRLDDVLLIRCVRHISVRQQNTSESTGAECGGCIAEERDRLVDEIERYCCAIDFAASVTNTEVCQALRAICAKVKKAAGSVTLTSHSSAPPRYYLSSAGYICDSQQTARLGRVQEKEGWMKCGAAICKELNANPGNADAIIEAWQSHLEPNT